MKILKVLIALLIACMCSTTLFAQEFIFPLKISSNKRYLEDENGKTFFYAADTAWKLFLSLTEEEVKLYLEDRKAKGFTAIQVMLTGFVDDITINGKAPFSDSNNFSSIDEAYMTKVEDVVAMAESMNLILSIAPLWAGCCGEGFAGSNDFIVNNGVEKSKDFGTYLGSRFNKYTNIIWIIGGDNDPGQSRKGYDALATGIKSKAPSHLITYHAASTHSSTDVWGNPEWLDISMIYTYFRGFDKAWNVKQTDVYEEGFSEYQKEPTKPFFLGESTYEKEHENWGSAHQIRKQAYWSVFSGGAGHAYGSINWKFPEDWKKNLELEGAKSMQYLKKLFYLMPFENSTPDISGKFVIDGKGKYASNDYTTSVISKDKTFAVSYIPSGRSLTVDASLLRGKKCNAFWYNPINGEIFLIGANKTKKALLFKTPSIDDWVLILGANIDILDKN